MHYIFKALALVVVYVLAAKIGLTFATLSIGATIVWPSGGIALAAVLIGGKRYLPAVFVGALLAGVMVKAPLIFGLGAAIGNTLEVYLGYVLLERYGHFKSLKLNSIQDLLMVVVLGGFIPSIASTLLGPLSLFATGLIGSDLLTSVMWRWWRGDVLGTAFFTPLILLFMQHRPYFRDAARVLEALAIWFLAIVIGQMVFLDWLPIKLFDAPPNITWVLPIIIWAGLRTGRRNTALIQLLFMGQALASAYLKVGIFSDEFARYGLSNFWMFGMLLALSGMALAILATAQRHSAKIIAQNAWVFDVSHDGVVITDADNKMVSVNAAFTGITGYTLEEVSGKSPRMLSSGRHNREFYAELWDTLNTTGYWSGDIWNRRKDGSVYLEQIAIHSIADLRGKVSSYLAIFSDITLKKAMQDAIAHQAQHDFLTNLPNRLLFCDRFSQQLAIAKRHHVKFALIYLDLDHFKPVNDNLGHAVGDDLLIAVANRLTALVREIDTVSRFGGDEFAILVSEVDAIDDVIILANKVLVALSQPFILNQHTIHVSASLGIALYPDHGFEMESMMRFADEAMYHAKRSGYNKYIIAGSY
ncbi:MAG: diguanylate cyclase [Methylotenera sp.]|nr:diguanylate cyclase [Methylotenera sp.]MDP2402397.1 diguanylate cyclase [Methylotenera sp.]MDP3094562.1 diguanylate cyclase [Methylotenera sp.]MDZ4222402.1 diguanylate cyclase [Methylotenera sp.]